MSQQTEGNKMARPNETRLIDINTGTKLSPIWVGAFVTFEDEKTLRATLFSGDPLHSIHIDKLRGRGELYRDPLNPREATLEKCDKVYNEIREELDAALRKFPTWPTRGLDAVGVLNEEVGELNKEIFQMTYEPHKTDKDKIRKEAVQAAAMAIRFLLSLEVYNYTPGEQHSQGGAI